jgi:hypothetical protein
MPNLNLPNRIRISPLRKVMRAMRTRTVGKAVSAVVRVAVMAEIDVAITTRGLSCSPAIIPSFLEKKVILREVIETVTKAIAIPRGSSMASGPTKIRLVSEIEKMLRRVPRRTPAVMVDNQDGTCIPIPDLFVSSFSIGSDDMLFY